MAKERKARLKRVTSLFMSAVMAATLVQVQLAPGAAAEESADSSSSTTVNADSLSIVSNKNAYRKYIARYPDAAKPMEEVNIDVTKFEQSDDIDVQLEDYDGEKKCVAWVDCEGTLTWKFDVKTAGLYNLEMFYHPITATNTTIEVEMKIDGEYPFDEVKLVELDRYWQNETQIGWDARKKNQKRPPQVEYNTWVTYPIKDKDGLINTPYFFYLSEGEHEISLTGIKTNFYLKSMKFYNTEELPSYADIKPTQEQIDATPAFGSSEDIGHIEAENTYYTTSSTLYPTYDRTDYSVSPSHPVNKRYNTVGADTWDQATQTIAWQVEIPEDGYYKMQIRCRQSTMRGFFSNRRVYVNGVVPCKEPYMKRTSHGMILGKDPERPGEFTKMSKSKGNVVNPDDVVKEYGADTLRLYEMFVGDFEKAAPWQENGIKGCKRFLDRVWAMQEKVVPGDEYSDKLRASMHKTIKKVSEDIETLKFNTAIATMMGLLNEIDAAGSLTRADYRTLLILLNPFAPHITEELYQVMGYEGVLNEQKWVEYDEKLCVEDSVEIVVQVNGKVKARFNAPVDCAKEELENLAFDLPEIKALTDGKTVVKKIAVPNKLVNIVVK